MRSDRRRALYQPAQCVGHMPDVADLPPADPYDFPIGAALRLGLRGADGLGGAVTGQVP